MQCPIRILRRGSCHIRLPDRLRSRGPSVALERGIGPSPYFRSLQHVALSTPQHLYVIRRKDRFSINHNRDRANLFQLRVSTRDIVVRCNLSAFWTADSPVTTPSGRRRTDRSSLVVRSGQQYKRGTGSVTTVSLAKAESRISYIC